MKNRRLRLDEEQPFQASNAHRLDVSPDVVVQPAPPVRVIGFAGASQLQANTSYFLDYLKQTSILVISRLNYESLTSSWGYNPYIVAPE